MRAKKSESQYVSLQSAPSCSSGLQHLDFSQDSRSFSLHADAHGVIVGLGELAGLELEIQVAQVLIDNFLALVKIGDAGLVSTGVEITTGQKNVNQHPGSEKAAENLGKKEKCLRTHISVSRWARARRLSRCGSRTASAAATGAVRSFQLRTTKRTSSSPKPSPATGRIHASSSNPWREGSTTAVTPQFLRNQLRTSSSLLMVCTLARSSLIMRAELGQPTWLHLSNIWSQLQVHMILPPRF